MSKIYELDVSLYKKISMYPTYDKFIFTSKGKKNVIAVDNSSGDFFVEDFSNKTKGLIYLVNESFLPNDVEKEYINNKDRYKNYKEIVLNKHDYLLNNNLYDTDFLEFDPNKKYEFDIDLGQGKKTFLATIKDAMGLATNNESDLFYRDMLLLSPLGFEYRDNERLIKKYIGAHNLDYDNFKDNFGIPYRRPYDKQICWFEKTNDIKI